MSCVSGAGLLFGFSNALASAKKKDAKAFDKVSKASITEISSLLSVVFNKRAFQWSEVSQWKAEVLLR